MDLKKKHKLLYVLPVELSGMQKEGFELPQFFKMTEAKWVETVPRLQWMAKYLLPVVRVRASLDNLTWTKAVPGCTPRCSFIHGNVALASIPCIDPLISPQKEMYNVLVLILQGLHSC